MDRKALVKTRHALGLSQEAFAKALGVSIGAISSWEADGTPRIGWEELEKRCKKLSPDMKTPGVLPKWKRVKKMSRVLVDAGAADARQADVPPLVQSTANVLLDPPTRRRTMLLLHDALKAGLTIERLLSVLGGDEWVQDENGARRFWAVEKKP